MAIAGLPPICGPLSAGGILGCVFDNNSDANVYNRKLQAMLTQLQSSLPGSKLVYADIFTPLVQISSDPLSHGTFFLYLGVNYKLLVLMILCTFSCISIYFHLNRWQVYYSP